MCNQDEVMMKLDYVEAARKVLQIERDAIDQVSAQLSQSFNDAIQLFLQSLESGGKIVIVGVGKSGNIGIKIAATLNSTGATAVLLNSQDALHGDLGIISPNDAVLAMSYSGETPELLTLLPYIQLQQVPIIALTKNPHSTLAQHARHTIDASVEQEACPLNLAPTSSSTAMLALGDALAMVLLQARGFTKEDFAKYHPGGSLGRALLTTVNDIMRVGDAIPTVAPNATVLDSLTAMSAKKAGICLIIEDEQLRGIFTHGDFVRLYTRNPNAGTQGIAQVMTTEPVTMIEGRLAVEAVNILREYSIDDLVVLSESGTPVGIVDSQDLAKHKLV